MSIYTRTGDSGQTSLFGGKRVSKSDALVDMYGSIDELNSWVGLVNAKCKMLNAKLLFPLSTIQSDLFTIGSTLAGWNGDLTQVEFRVGQMEQWIDTMEKSVGSITNFILPGGSELGAEIHITRNVCRRVERQLVALAKKQSVDLRVIKYLNRLSDLFFMLARFINKHDKVEEVTWSGIPRKTIINKKPRRENGRGM